MQDPLGGQQLLPEVPDFPGRATVTLSDPAGSGWLGSTLIDEVLGMRKEATDRKRYGPYVLYVSPDWALYLDADYSANKGENTLRQRVLAIEGISAIRQLDYLTGKSDKSARDDFYYFNDDGLLVGMRFENWKVVFCEQRAPGGFVGGDGGADDGLGHGSILPRFRGRAPTSADLAGVTQSRVCCIELGRESGVLLWNEGHGLAACPSDKPSRQST